jgi:A/G-specific adenine glycosylase
MYFSKQIVSWYHKNKRSLPWRKTKDPYKIWLSEIILQQTKIKQGLPYYKKFIISFPTIHDLANASENKVLNLWQGLGYYTRARNLHLTAKEISKKNDGLFPNTYKKIIKLKGVGTYTAAAIASFAFNLPFAVVDGNVIRVLSRFFGIIELFDTVKGKKIFQKKAQELLDLNNVNIYNQAIMEFGALQCVPKSPDCAICQIKIRCFAFNQNKVTQLPIKKSKLIIKKRYINFLIICENDNILIQKRNNGIWKGLYQFPIIENNIEKAEGDISNSIEWNSLFNNNEKILKISPIIKHKLSHQLIFARFWHIKSKHNINNNIISIAKEDIDKYPIPRLIEKYLENNEMI